MTGQLRRLTPSWHLILPLNFVDVRVYSAPDLYFAIKFSRLSTARYHHMSFVQNLLSQIGYSKIIIRLYWLLPLLFSNYLLQRQNITISFEIHQEYYIVPIKYIFIHISKNIFFFFMQIARIMVWYIKTTQNVNSSGSF